VGSQFENLTSPIVDGSAMKIWMESNSFDEVTIFTNKSRNEIQNVFEIFKKEKYNEKRLLFIYYSGHGIYQDASTFAVF